MNLWSPVKSCPYYDKYAECVNCNPDVNYVIKQVFFCDMFVVYGVIAFIVLIMVAALIFGRKRNKSEAKEE